MPRSARFLAIGPRVLAARLVSALATKKGLCGLRSVFGFNDRIPLRESFFEAARNNDLATLEQLARSMQGWSVARKDKALARSDDDTPLDVALRKKSWEAVAFLLEQGFDSYKAEPDGQRADHTASLGRYIEAPESLFSAQIFRTLNDAKTHTPKGRVIPSPLMTTYRTRVLDIVVANLACRTLLPLDADSQGRLVELFETLTATTAGWGGPDSLSLEERLDRLRTGSGAGAWFAYGMDVGTARGGAEILQNLLHTVPVARALQAGVPQAKDVALAKPRRL
jgi:hypothetical protein